MDILKLLDYPVKMPSRYCVYKYYFVIYKPIQFIHMYGYLTTEKLSRVYNIIFNNVNKSLFLPNLRYYRLIGC